jgi:hypothetical protein
MMHHNHKWAVVHVRELLEKWQQQQPGVPVEQLVEAAGLRHHLDAYAWLNDELRGLRVSRAWLLPHGQVLTVLQVAL